MQPSTVVNTADTKPKMVIRKRNYVKITWRHTFANHVEGDDYKLQILDDLKEWKTIYW